MRLRDKLIPHSEKMYLQQFWWLIWDSLMRQKSWCQLCKCEALLGVFFFFFLFSFWELTSTKTSTWLQELVMNIFFFSTGRDLLIIKIILIIRIQKIIGRSFTLKHKVQCGGHCNDCVKSSWTSWVTAEWFHRLKPLVVVLGTSLSCFLGCIKKENAWQKRKAVVRGGTQTMPCVA